MRHLKSIFIILTMLAVPALAAADQKSGGSKPRPPITLKNKLGHGHIIYNWTMPCLIDSDTYSPTPAKIIGPRYGYY